MYKNLCKYSYSIAMSKSISMSMSKINVNFKSQFQFQKSMSMSKINFNNNNIQYIYIMILVTGATGLVGSHLILQLLEQGEKVRAMCRSEAGKLKVKMVFDQYKKEYLFDKIIWCQADILDVSALKNCFIDIEYVYHCAALISFEPSDVNKLRKINIEGTANIVNFCLDFNVKKLCFVSSIAALGDLAPHETIYTENTEWNAEKSHSDYAISKYGAELEVWRGQQEGLSVVIVNPGVILGPVFWTDGSGEIYQKTSKGLPFYTKGITGFVGIQDVINLMILIMKSNINGERFILVSENVTYQKILETIADKLHVKRPKFYANHMMTSIYWKVDWIITLLTRKKRILSKQMHSSLHSQDLYDNQKVKKQFQYNFEDIEATLTNHLQ